MDMHGMRPAELPADDFVALRAELKRELRAGATDSGLIEKARKLSLRLTADGVSVSSVDRRHLATRCLTSETLDHFGYYAEAKAEVQLGAEIVEQLPLEDQIAKLSEASRADAKVRVRYTLSYALALYREHRYQDAEAFALRAAAVARALSPDVNPLLPCYGTLGGALYLLGRVNRQMGRYEQAMEHFHEAIAFYDRRAELKRSEVLDPARRCAEVSFSTHRSALVAALGMGWVYYARGELTKARQEIYRARSTLSLADDLVNWHYVNLLLSSIKRVEAGNDLVALKEARDIAAVALDGFQRMKHASYRNRAPWELAQIEFYRGNTKAALVEIKEVSAAAKDASDYRLISSALIMESRMVRASQDAIPQGMTNRPIELATDALEMAQVHGLGVCQAEALIARGVAYVYRGANAQAINDLHAALRVATSLMTLKECVAENSHPMLCAVCYVFLARSYCNIGDADNAKRYFSKWEELKSSIEHKRLHDRAREVWAEIGRMKGFHIGRKEVDLDYSRHKSALRRFLLDVASERTAGDRAQITAIAKALKMTLGGLYRWKEFQEWRERHKGALADDGAPTSNPKGRRVS